MTENSVRHIDTLREMEAHKRHYQIRFSHHELEFSAKDNVHNMWQELDLRAGARLF
ncbi:MAG: hypothetical protein QXX64_00235 [Nitrososphaera sp.]|uniref:hypothetical protein n=1 Tax=Candidatus Nitrososphaera gargensis TaxID=497727 RepID=UPI001650C43E|nr:hypothetical protein [Candidatus Nitrososphaera gargensis]